MDAEQSNSPSSLLALLPPVQFLVPRGRPSASICVHLRLKTFNHAVARVLGQALSSVTLALALALATGGLAAAPAPLPDIGAAFFQSSNVHHLTVEVASADLARLRQDPREDVRATVRVG